VHEAVVAKIGSTPVGSEHQLAAFRLAVSTSDDASELRGWLDTAPEGIDIDLDLRWRVLVRLAALGATSAEELDAALDAEPTAQSRVEHMRALVSLPTAEAKARAWDVFTGALDVPNYELEAAGLGMWQAGQEELTAPYVDRYFEELPATVAVRSGWVLADATEFFFPVTSVTEETLARAQALAADEGLDLSMRRRLSDAADDLARQLAVRRRFPVS
jgi:aminopeptidase N